jgi:hypothetical protein
MWEVYEKVYGQNGAKSELTTEDLAFSKLLLQHMKVQENGTVLFDLYQDHIMPSDTPDELLKLIDNRKYLQVDCLCADDV